MIGSLLRFFCVIALTLMLPLKSFSQVQHILTVEQKIPFTVQTLTPPVQIPRIRQQGWVDISDPQQLALWAVSSMLRGDVQSFLALYHPDERRKMMGRSTAFWRNLWLKTFDDRIDVYLTRYVTSGDMVLFEVSDGSQSLFDLPLMSQKSFTGEKKYYITDRWQGAPVLKYWRKGTVTVPK